MASENSPYQCEICGAEFETPGAKGGHKKGHETKVSREEVQRALRKLAEESGQTPTVKMMNGQGEYSAGCVKSRLGSWEEALRSIGLTPNLRTDITKADIKADIRSVANKLGHAPTSKEQREHGEFAVKQAQNRFGSWNEALQAVGFEPHLRKHIPEDALLAEIHELVDRLGRTPTASDMKQYGQFSHRPYFSRWNGWQAAVRAAGYEPVGRPSGPDNHKWKESPTHEWREYGRNWDEQREKALERDNYTCQTPGCSQSQSEHIDEFGRGLHVHHIQPLHMFGDTADQVDFEEANRLDNLVTVCVEHHHIWERLSPLRPDLRHLSE
jgi:hypothetical protein